MGLAIDIDRNPRVPAYPFRMSRSSMFRSWILPAFVLAALVLLLLLSSGSLLIARKVGALLVMPIGAIWLVGLFFLLRPGGKRGFRLLIGIFWLVYSLAANPLVGNALLRTLERPLYRYENLEEPLDALVLLGGGTATSPAGNPALGTHGDRVLRPAVLFHEGFAPILITTGRSITEKGEDRILSEETAEIWQSLGIPEASIYQLPDPRNTAEELEVIADLLAKEPDWKRVGICSSASHLRRALKQAGKQGLDLVPVPSDFRSGPLPLSPLYLVPQARGFRDVQTALWEYLGALF